MRPLIFFGFLFITVYNVFSQTNYPPCQAYDTTGKAVIRTLTSFSNTLYSGVDNVFEINNTALKLDSFFVKAENGHLFRESKFKYLIIPSKIGVSKIKIYSKSDSSLAFSTELKVVRLPKPYIVLDHQKFKDTIKISRVTLLKIKTFGVELTPDLILEENMYDINDFSIGYKYGNLYVRKNTMGNTLSKEMQNIISNLKSGQEVDFQFYIKSEGDLIQTIPPVKVIIY